MDPDPQPVNMLVINDALDHSKYCTDFYAMKSVSGLGFESDLARNRKFRIKPDPDPQHGLPYGIKIQMLFCAGFKPNMYRLMQTTGKTLEMAVNFTKLFHAKRNRQQFFVFPSQIDISAVSPLLN
jgi:hypothetical protein